MRRDEHPRGSPLVENYSKAAEDAAVAVIAQYLSSEAVLSDPRRGNQQRFGQVIDDVRVFELNYIGDVGGTKFVLSEQDQRLFVMLQEEEVGQVGRWDSSTAGGSYDDPVDGCQLVLI